MSVSRKTVHTSFPYQLLEEQRFALDRLDLAFRWGSYGVRVLRCHLTRFPPGKVVPFHKHSEYEFHFIPRGKGKVILGGQEFRLRPGLFYLTGPEVVHYQEADADEAMDELCLHVEIQDINDPYPQSKSSGSWGLDIERQEAEECVRHLAQFPLVPVEDQYDAMRWFLTAYRAWYENHHGAYTTIKQAIIQILLRSVQNVVDKRGPFQLPERHMNAHRYQLATQFMQDNYAATITLDDVADRLHISGRQLQRVFSEHAGQTFQEYLETIRLFHVCNELMNTGKGLDEIAGDHGFASSNYLYYVFKKRMGMTPREYRQTNRTPPYEKSSLPPSNQDR